MPAWAVDPKAVRYLLQAQAYLLLLMPPPLQSRLYHLSGRPCKLLRLLPCIAGLHSGRLSWGGPGPLFGPGGGLAVWALPLTSCSHLLLRFLDELLRFLMLLLLLVLQQGGLCQLVVHPLEES